MAYKSLGTFSWGSGPVITGTFYYDKSRSGTSMKYKIKIVIDPVTGSSYFGYPIRTKIYLDGTKKASATLKDVSPNRWSDPIVYETSWITVSNKTSGTTSLIINLYSDSGSTRDTDYKKSLEVDPATSAIGKVSAFNIGDTIKVGIILEFTTVVRV